MVVEIAIAERDSPSSRVAMRGSGTGVMAIIAVQNAQFIVEEMR
ncbi:hypothetical protein [Gordonia sp. NB41Y]|nr:hypothetical protein [Gordonia sp. NB41Y]WLP91366.1 hypothetical protein Q9K23_03585 [Gordonia sp. NB41Y]